MYLNLSWRTICPIRPLLSGRRSGLNRFHCIFTSLNWQWVLCICPVLKAVLRWVYVSTQWFIMMIIKLSALTFLPEMVFGQVACCWNGVTVHPPFFFWTITRECLDRSTLNLVCGLVTMRGRSSLNMGTRWHHMNIICPYLQLAPYVAGDVFPCLKVTGIFICVWVWLVCYTYYMGSCCYVFQLWVLTYSPVLMIQDDNLNDVSSSACA